MCYDFKYEVAAEFKKDEEAIKNLWKLVGESLSRKYKTTTMN